MGLKQFEDRALLALNLPETSVCTSFFPQTHILLQTFLPGIFHHRCFNYKCLPFSEEVKKTTTGHLFEHILLEYLFQFSSKKGQGKTFKGLTSWNWKTYQKGTFQITVSCSLQERAILLESIKKSTDLFSVIFETQISSLVGENQKQRDG